MGKQKKYRKGVFVVVYKIVNGKIKYLVLHRKLHWKGWEFPKGGLEKNEKLRDCVKREVMEECGLEPIKIIDLKTSGKFKYKKEFSDRKGFVGQSWRLFCAEVKGKKVKIDKLEHDNYRWVGFEEAIKMLKWKNQKKCLRISENHLKMNLRFST